MTTKNKGDEPSFPTSQVAKYLWHYKGISKREYIAAKAMQGILAGWGYYPSNVENAAKQAVQQADALIAELNKEKP